MSIFELIPLAIIGLLIFAGFTAYIAAEKGYSSQLWFTLGFFFPIVALIAAVGLPKKS